MLVRAGVMGGGLDVYFVVGVFSFREARLIIRMGRWTTVTAEGC